MSLCGKYEKGNRKKLEMEKKKKKGERVKSKE
jgi:hypothetical protein